MNRKKKLNQTLKNRLKKSNAKLQKTNKPKYVSKAVRVQSALDEANLNTIVETERLSLNVLNVADAAMIYSLFNQANVLEFVGNKNINTVNDAEKYIFEDQQVKQLECGFSFYCVRLKENDTPIGICGLIKRSESEAEELGFAILNDYAQRGYIKEAAKAVVLFANSELKLTSLIAKTNSDNVVSIKLLTSLGFSAQLNETGDTLNHYRITL
jgi:RimJ/RimL family protein N-acetyltransferase